MKAKTEFSTVVTAVEQVNREKGYQLSFNRLEQKNGKIEFTLKSPSGIRGARLSASGRLHACASWHAHGYVIDRIFEIDPYCILWSLGQKYTRETWTWADRPIGRNVKMSDVSIL